MVEIEQDIEPTISAIVMRGPEAPVAHPGKRKSKAKQATIPAPPKNDRRVDESHMNKVVTRSNKRRHEMPVFDSSGKLSSNGEALFKPGDSLTDMQENAGEFFKSGVQNLFDKVKQDEEDKLAALVAAEYYPESPVDQGPSEDGVIKGQMNFV